MVSILDLFTEDVVETNSAFKTTCPDCGLQGGRTQGFILFPQNNTWFCQSSQKHGGILELVAIQEGIIKCMDCNGTGEKERILTGEMYKETLDLLEERFEEEIFNEFLDILNIQIPIKKGKEEKGGEKENVRRTSGKIFDKQKIIIEQVLTEEGKSLFCMYNDETKEIKLVKKFGIGGIPYFPHEGEEVEKKAILLPTEAEDYIDDDTLDKRILDFIHKWLDVPKEFERFGLWNIKRSWVYQKFHTLNYLRFLGDTGTGKTRGLDVMGSIHYKPINTSGSTTAAPLFRVIDKWRGTIIIDEADLKQSDETADIIKIINQGFEKGKFIMRCDQNDANQINFFDPYCNKLLGTRKSFTDKATESRCITHVCSETDRKDIPLNLNKDFFEETQTLRNMLLMWRFKNYFKIDCETEVDFGDLEPRVKQLVTSYSALFGNDITQMGEFKDYIKEYQEDLVDERQSSWDGMIVGAIHQLIKKGKINITAKEIIEEGEFTNRTGDKKMSPRGLTSPLKSLGFGKSKEERVGNEKKRIIPLDQKHLEKIFKRYGYKCSDVPVVPVTKGSPQSEQIEEKDTLTPVFDKIVPVAPLSHITGTTGTSEHSKIQENDRKLQFFNDQNCKDEKLKELELI